MQALLPKPCVLCSLVLAQLATAQCSLHGTQEPLVGSDVQANSERRDGEWLGPPPEQRSHVEQVAWAVRHPEPAVPAVRESYRRIVERLRSEGPPALSALRAAYRLESNQDRAREEGWRYLIDQVAQQRDAVYGGIFWYRDLTRAQKAAKATGRPILSLRLLGELTDEFSCANSRLFRTVLYADPDLASWLTAEFVLHWSSERPVPTVEIDFGDGRTLRRTITGNSAHYVLDASGDTIDIVPGLWAPEAFRGALATSLQLHQRFTLARRAEAKREILRTYHERQQHDAEAKLSQAQAQLGRESHAPGGPLGRRHVTARVPAIQAVPMAMSKARIEAPVLEAAPRMIGGRGIDAESVATVGTGLSEAEYLRLGQTMFEPYQLAANTAEIIRREQVLDHISGPDLRAQVTRRMVAELRASVLADTAKNALELRPQIHRELARRLRARQQLDFESINTWVYASLFQTPAGDPWLGLVDDTVYTGLVGSGIAQVQ